jgi:ubiquinone/menaquinone biosynthesis C-methylase UbiE
MGEAERSYLPAAGKRWLLPLYDPVLWLLGADQPKRLLIDQAGMRSGFRVLDVGCGTGTLAVQIKKLHPDSEVVALDPDPAALSVAERKAKRAKIAVEFDRGFSDHMSYPDASFDRVFSSFMFHHLSKEERLATLVEIRRVLKRRGSLHLLDFAPHDGASHENGGHRFHLAPHPQERFEGHMTALMSEAGFEEPSQLARGKIIFGAIAYYRAQAPA